MAGTGKSTFMQMINSYVIKENIPSYFINLDPAVSKLSFAANIDIRDSVNYKEVMKRYNLGPNGGILTALNLFATRFDQVMKYVENRAKNLKYVFVDTPGQIEAFNWSASGTIITKTFASTFPTMFVYVVDTPRCVSPNTFMSNMLYACSLLYKNRLPLVLAFNKTDILSYDFCLEWMRDSERFDEAARSQNNYMGTFMQSLGLMLQEFYCNLSVVGLSAVTGKGIKEFIVSTRESAQVYESTFKQDLLHRLQLEKDREYQSHELQLKKLNEHLKQEQKSTPNPLEISNSDSGKISIETASSTLASMQIPATPVQNFSARKQESFINPDITQVSKSHSQNRSTNPHKIPKVFKPLGNEFACNDTTTNNNNNDDEDNEDEEDNEELQKFEQFKKELQTKGI